MKPSSLRIVPACFVFAVLFAEVPVLAQQGAQNQPNIPPVLAKIEVTLTRFQGTTRTASFPHVLMAPTNGDRTSLRLGVRVPTGANNVRTNEGTTTSTPEYQTVGTNIDLDVRALQSGVYRLWILVFDTSIHPTKLEGMNPSLVQPLAFREYSAGQTVLLRSGEEVEFSVGTDKVTGETVRASVRRTVPQ
jgi:hypothetical protein